MVFKIEPTHTRAYEISNLQGYKTMLSNWQEIWNTCRKCSLIFLTEKTTQHPPAIIPNSNPQNSE